jgi:hypothetical protein
LLLRAISPSILKTLYFKDPPYPPSFAGKRPSEGGLLSEAYIEIDRGLLAYVYLFICDISSL